MTQEEFDIQVKDLLVTYEDGTSAVKGISFSVKKGDLFGFLGPNGAGKSTTIKILTTLLRKTSGSVTIAGHDLDTDSREIRGIIGVQAQETSIDPELTGRENIILAALLKQLRGEKLRHEVDWLLEALQLTDVADKPAGEYSVGMKKRLDLATSLVHEPEVLFLDEPTTGLDPQSRTAIWKYLEWLNKTKGITVFLATPCMEEAARLCRNLCIVDGGKIVVQGSPNGLKQVIGADTISIRIKSEANQIDEMNREGRGVVLL